MNDDANKVSPRKKSWRMLWIFVSSLLAIPLLACGGLATWFLARHKTAAQERDVRLIQLTESGAPIDNESLQLWFQSQTSSENTDAWHALANELDSDFQAELNALLVKDKHGGLIAQGSVPAPGDQWPDRNAVDDFLNTWNDRLAELHRLSQAEGRKNNLRRPIRFNSFETALDGTNKVLTFVKLLELQHARALFDGDLETACACIRSLRGLQRSTFGEPLIVCADVGNIAATTANRLLQETLQESSFSNKQAKQMSSDLVSFDQMHDVYISVLKGERALGLPMFSETEKMNQLLRDSSMDESRFLVNFRAKDSLFYLDVYKTLLKVPDDDMAAFRSGVSNATDEIQSLAANSKAIDRVDLAFSFKMLPSFNTFADSIVKRVENDRLAALALSVRSYRQQNGDWPKTLDALSEIGIDLSQLTQADGSPFTYEIESNEDAVLGGIGGDEQYDRNVWTWRLKPTDPSP